MKGRNPSFGYQRIAEQISLVFNVDIDRDIVRRILAKQSAIPDQKVVRLHDYRWEKHCRGLYQLPEAATLILPATDTQPLLQPHRYACIDVAS